MASEGLGAARWWTSTGFCLVLLASVAFKSMVGIAIPDLQPDLDAGLGQLQWVLNAYTLMLAALLVSADAAADRYGRRRAYLVGLAIFATGAVACQVRPLVLPGGLPRPVLGNTPTDTGLKLLPLTAVAFAAAPAGSWLMRRVPPRTLVPLCLLIMAIGSWLLRAVGPDSSWTALVPGFVVIGLGSGAIVPVMVRAVSATAWTSSARVSPRSGTGT